MAGSFSADVSQVMALAATSSRAQAVVKKNLGASGRKAGFIVEGQAKVEAPVGETGNLRAGIGPPLVRQSGVSTEVLVVSHAEYSAAVHDGRKAIVRESGQGPLVWVAKSGETVFTMKTKAVPANPYMDRGLTKSEAKIVTVFNEALTNSIREFGFS